MMSETEKNTELETDTKTMNKDVTVEETEKVAQTQLQKEEITEHSENESNNKKDDDSTCAKEEQNIPEGFEQIETTASTEESSEEESSEKDVTTLEEKIVSLKEQLAVQIEKEQSIQNQYMRLNADFENFRRRSIREKEELENMVKKKTINELLSIVDNFERARSHIKPANDGEMAIHKSYQGVYKTFVDSLKKIGVSAMRPEGKAFDPNYHEAMMREPTNEYPDGTVIEQLVRGYLLHDQVLRHAMVKVSTAIEEEQVIDNVNESVSEEQEQN